MDNEDLLEIPKIIPDIIKKEMKIQFDGSQYLVRIPMFLIDELNIKKGDIAIFEYDSRDKSYSIKLKTKNAATKKKKTKNKKT